MRVPSRPRALARLDGQTAGIRRATALRQEGGYRMGLRLLAGVSYGHTRELGSCGRAATSGEDRCVFLLSACVFGAGTATAMVSLV
jgi:hypothetical protein